MVAQYPPPGGLEAGFPTAALALFRAQTALRHVSGLSPSLSAISPQLRPSARRIDAASTLRGVTLRGRPPLPRAGSAGPVPGTSLNSAGLGAPTGFGLTPSIRRFGYLARQGSKPGFGQFSDRAFRFVSSLSIARRTPFLVMATPPRESRRTMSFNEAPSLLQSQSWACVCGSIFGSRPIRPPPSTCFRTPILAIADRACQPSATPMPKSIAWGTTSPCADRRLTSSPRWLHMWRICPVRSLRERSFSRGSATSRTILGSLDHCRTVALRRWKW